MDPLKKIVHNHSNRSKMALALVKTGVGVRVVNDRWDRTDLPGVMLGLDPTLVCSERRGDQTD
jgi:hypothetical protein